MFYLLHNLLVSFSKDALYPSECLVTNAVVVELNSKAPMSHFIERLAEIQKNSNDLFSLVQSADQVMNCCYELRLTRPSLSEVMLLVTKDVMIVNVLHEMAVDYVFHDLGTV